MNLICSWSGGKDSCFALMQAIQQGHKLKVIFNMMNENNKISRSHGITRLILEQQAKALAVELVTMAGTWNTYEENYIKMLQQIKSQFAVEGIVFGDIDIEQHKEWEEKVSLTAELKPLLPLWKHNRKALVYQMIDSGIKCIITSCNEHLGKSFLGREITKSLVDEFERLDVDACGENGEYHTLVTNCPLFSKPIELPSYSKKSNNGYNFIVWDD